MQPLWRVREDSAVAGCRAAQVRWIDAVPGCCLAVDRCGHFPVWRPELCSAHMSRMSKQTRKYSAPGAVQCLRQ